jgi:hypothetical protein
MTLVKSYEMPRAEIGQSVVYDYGDSERAAIVLRVGTDTLTLQVFDEHLRGGDVVTGVRHESDPDKAKIAASGVGVWRHTNFTRIVNEVAEQLALTTGSE